MSEWRWELHGGGYDGWDGDFLPGIEPTPRLFIWTCPDACELPVCPGHGSRSAHDPYINLQTVEAYELVAIDLDERLATYTIGDGVGDAEEREAREFVGAGAFVPDVEAFRRGYEEIVKRWQDYVDEVA